MLKCFGFGFSENVSQHGSVLVPRETLGCVSTHYRVEAFIGVHSGDVKMVLFCHSGDVWFDWSHSGGEWFDSVTREM